MPVKNVKKTVVRKKASTSPATKGATKAPPVKKSSPRKGVVKEASPALTHDLARVTYTEADKNKRVQGMTFRQLAERLDVSMESVTFAVAVEILKGAQTRQDVNHRVRDVLPPRDSTATPKGTSNLVSGVIRKMLDCGFTVEGQWRMVKPVK